MPLSTENVGPNSTRVTPSRWVGVARFALGLSILLYFAYVVVGDLPRLSEYVVSFDAKRSAWLVVCTVLLGTGPFFSVAVFRSLAQRYARVPLPYLACLRLLLWSNLLRYVPGRFFGVVYQASAPLPGLSGADMLRINLEQLGLTLVGNTLSAFAVLSFARDRFVLGLALLALALTALRIGARANWPLRAHGFIRAWLPARYRQLAANDARALDAGSCWTIALLTVGSLLPYLLAWSLLGKVFPELGAQPLAALGASYVVGWAAGVLVFVTPGGLGVREGIFLLLSPHVAREALALLSIFARAWHLFADIAAWLIGALLARLGARPSAAAQATAGTAKPDL